MDVHDDASPNFSTQLQTELPKAVSLLQLSTNYCSVICAR